MQEIHFLGKYLLSLVGSIQEAREDNAFMPYTSGQWCLLSDRAACSASAFCRWDYTFLSVRDRLSMQDCYMFFKMNTRHAGGKGQVEGEYNSS